MAESKKKGLISHGVAAQNRKARYDYTIKDTVEAGIVLKGPEVKSLRLGRATLTEAAQAAAQEEADRAAFGGGVEAGCDAGSVADPFQ
jgi:tmRNA-binding protein